jgi:hypothetical protein
MILNDRADKKAITVRLEGPNGRLRNWPKWLAAKLLACDGQLWYGVENSNLRRWKHAAKAIGQTAVRQPAERHTFHSH